MINLKNINAKDFDDLKEGKHNKTMSLEKDIEFKVLEDYSGKQVKEHELRIITAEKEKLDKKLEDLETITNL